MDAQTEKDVVCVRRYFNKKSGVADSTVMICRLCKKEVKAAHGELAIII
jgi:RIO-like serine/threonine protein kinase